MVYAKCGILGFFKEEYDVSSVCDPATTMFHNGKCVSTVDVTTDNASVCDPATTMFHNGKCVSTVDVTTDNASVCDPYTTMFQNGKCVSAYPDVRFELYNCLGDPNDVATRAAAAMQTLGPLQRIQLEGLDDDALARNNVVGLRQ